mgnify:CR=1 FL=1
MEPNLPITELGANKDTGLLIIELGPKKEGSEADRAITCKVLGPFNSQDHLVKYVHKHGREANFPKNGFIVHGTRFNIDDFFGVDTEEVGSQKRESVEEDDGN